MEVLTTKESASWMNVLHECGRYDFYHLPRYHALAEQAGEGMAHLFVHREAGHTIALPLLIRSLAGLPGAQANWNDATSVYGYAGPIGSAAPEPVIRHFQEALQERLRELEVVALFSRLHTFFPQQELLAGLGDCQTLKQTVSIDLTQPIEKQRAGYRKNHKEGVNRLRRAGLKCVEDTDRRYLADFVALYHETMRRVDATPEYFFPRAYFEELLASLETPARLFVCLQGSQVVCGGVFIHCCGILQYHLGGTRDDALRAAPMKLLVDDVRLWANREGHSVLHLGGGVSCGADDQLLHFKLGFSDRVHDFRVWRWILNADAYQRLCDEKSKGDRLAGLQSSSGFFPAYRAPAIASQTATIAPSVSVIDGNQLATGVTP
ncbi:MAG: GNAT family N-acetyltransferase [Planctomycetes bacterium]|nr:GNAT family N-acetyltransferase [Planctomycetota bacterium]